MGKITFDDYVLHTDKVYLNSHKKYLLKKYKEYLSLTKEDIDYINNLKLNEGKEVIFYYGRNKTRKMILTYVQTTVEKGHDRYFSCLYDVRLNYLDDGKIREWEGFWTDKFYNIKINL